MIWLKWRYYYVRKRKTTYIQPKIINRRFIKPKKRKYEIARELDKSTSTISREINKNRVIKVYNAFNRKNLFNCKYFVNCKVCTEKCKIFQPLTCKERDRNIGACNNCQALSTCTLDKNFYFAKKAQENYEYTLRDSRMGVNLNTSKLIELAHKICPLIKQGQSIYIILRNYPKIKQCEKTIYNYIEMGLFRDWGVTDITLKRKVKRRIPRIFSFVPLFLFSIIKSNNIIM